MFIPENVGPEEHLVIRGKTSTHLPTYKLKIEVGKASKDSRFSCKNER